jgi:hypothetical protein
VIDAPPFDNGADHVKVNDVFVIEDATGVPGAEAALVNVVRLVVE